MQYMRGRRRIDPGSGSFFTDEKRGETTAEAPMSLCTLSEYWHSHTQDTDSFHKPRQKKLSVYCVSVKKYTRLFWYYTSYCYFLQFWRQQIDLPFLRRHITRHALRAAACEGGHGTDRERNRGREGDKVFALCSHIGRGFSPDPCGVSRELLLSSSPLFLQYLSDVRTEGVGGRSGMGATAVVSPADS